MPPLFDLIASGEVQVNQILIELHLGVEALNFGNIYGFFLAADRAKFRITHKERNHWGCGGATCVEYSFVSESYLREANGSILCQSTAAV